MTGALAWNSRRGRVVTQVGGEAESFLRGMVGGVVQQLMPAVTVEAALVREADE